MISHATTSETVREIPATETVAAAAAHLRRVTGIITPEHRLAALDAVLERHLGPLADRSAEDVVEQIKADPALRASLINEIAIPETYMFRHPGHFVALEQYARERSERNQSMRILSAGCASGEEAWSAAAVLERVFSQRGKTFQIVGWDLDRYRLERARAGAYRGWSARNGLNGYDQFFERTEEGYRVRQTLLQLVRWEERNLVMRAATDANEGSFDVIFFRNVAIYWDANTARVVTRWLSSMVREGGLLLVGPSDPVELDRSEWTADIVSSALVYRKQSRRVAESRHPRPSGFRTTAPRRNEPASVRESAKVGASFLLEDRPPLSMLDQARTLADAGQVERALKLLGDHVDELDGAGRQLAGILLFSIGDYAQAAERLRQAVFLMPDDAVSRRWLSLALESSGQVAEAERERRALRNIGGNQR